MNHLSENPGVWTDYAEKLIQKTSKGKLRVVQSLYSSPSELSIRHIPLHALSESEILQMHPEWMNEIRAVHQGSFYFIFACNSALEDGRAYVATAVLSL